MTYSMFLDPSTEIDRFECVAPSEKSLRHLVYFYGEIEDPGVYIPLFQVIRTLKDTDTLELVVNSPGGDFNTCVQLVNEIRLSNGIVKTVGTGTVASSAAIIFLSGHERYFEDYSQLLLHSTSTSVVGKTENVVAMLSVQIKIEAEMMRDYCHPFLTEEEIKHMNAGADLCFGSTEVRKRLNITCRGDSNKSKNNK